MVRGYFRLGSDGTQVQENLVALIEAGASSGNIFFDVSGNQEFHRILGLLREGDTLLVTKVADLGSDVKELFGVLRTLEKRKAGIRSLAEPWFELSLATMRNETLYMLIEQLYLLARKMEDKASEGEQARRPVGRPVGGLQETMSKMERAFKLYDEEPFVPVADICRKVGLNERTFYRHLCNRHPQQVVPRSKGRKSKNCDL